MNIKKRILSIVTSIATVFSAGGFTAAAEKTTYPETFAEYTQLKEDYPQMYRIDEDSVYFINQNISNASMSLIVSSNQDSEVIHNTYGCIFTPDEDGRYVVTEQELREEIVGAGSTGHFHYFYPVTVNYVVDVENSEITVEKKGTVSWYSESQISEEIEEAEKITAESEEIIAPMCGYVMAEGSEDILDSNYFSFVNGQLPDNENCSDSYITNVYDEYSVKSYFCVHDMSESDISLLESNTALKYNLFYTCSYLDGNYDLGTDNVMQLFRIEASQDGDITIIGGSSEYNLTVKDGVFHHAEEVQMSNVDGDVDNDGEFTLVDIVRFRKYLVGKENIICLNNADFNNDGKINVFDFCIMKRTMLNKKPVLTSDTCFVGTAYSESTVTFTLDANNYWLSAPCDAIPNAQLYNADTNELVAVMEHQGDNIWTCTVEIDNSEMGEVNFYAAVNGKNGSSGFVMKSDTLTISVLHAYPVEAIY